MGYRKRSNVWIENADKIGSRSRGLFSYILKNTVTTLKGTALMAYPIHANILSFSVRLKQWSIDDGRTLAKILPIFCNEKHLRCEGSGGDDDESV